MTDLSAIQLRTGPWVVCRSDGSWLAITGNDDEAERVARRIASTYTEPGCPVHGERAMGPTHCCRVTVDGEWCGRLLQP